MDDKPGHVYQIRKLVEGNYEVWRIQMSAILVALDLWNVVRSGLGGPDQGHNTEGPERGTGAAEEAGDGKVEDHHGYRSIPSTFCDGYGKPSRDVGGT